MNVQHKYDFGDLVTVLTGEVGEVVGVWYRYGIWLYKVDGLSHMGAAWWGENHLDRPTEAEISQLNQQRYGENK